MIDLDMTPAQTMVCAGAGADPEQLFAAGCGACLPGALGRVASREGSDVTDRSVGTVTEDSAVLRDGGAGPGRLCAPGAPPPHTLGLLVEI
ncbi:hypothetical protein [Nesterenkonia lutea]|uniref:Organic hydroperoxide reductase OsmC/OhrA n=1 Tax=Nesterenkonia lutea TaxID=272919 RepID=A0ABR9JH48_9MICC|nr:hypothetical protein [Nesterenkonia lutea]MBE1525250.1 organic hydroperoxide reductase OsmC/OhrA [Nesterenkonia lutea]